MIEASRRARPEEPPTPLDRTCATPGCRAPRDRWLVLQLMIALPVLSAALRLVGFRRTHRALAWLSRRRAASEFRRPATRSARAGGHSPAGAPGRHLRRRPRHIADVVVHVNRHVLPYQSKCLLESLTLWHLLRRRGYPADLLLGARTLLGPLEAHAWVELAGEVLNDNANVGDVYAPFDMSVLSTDLESR